MDRINDKIHSLLKEFGFEQITVEEMLYFYKGCYYKISYVKGLESFVIESADNYDDVVMNVFEDSDLLPLSLGEDGIIKELRYILINYYV